MAMQNSVRQPQNQITANLERLFDAFAYLDSFETEISVEVLTQVLGHIPLSLEDLTEYSLFNDNCYQRNLIYDGSCFRALLLCWKSGQRSPIHNHYGSNCFVRVIQGVATEIAFKKTRSGEWCPSGVTELGVGEICASVDPDTHIIGNFQAPEENLVTLHVYSPPLKGMGIIPVKDTVFANDQSVIEFSLSAVTEKTKSDWAATRDK